MALSIKTVAADRLARELAALTGETMTQAVTEALKERLERLQAIRRHQREDIARNLLEVAEDIRASYELEPVGKDEWDRLWGEDGGHR